jgi:DNA-binding NarL/FixJ family response regulator
MSQLKDVMVVGEASNGTEVMEILANTNAHIVLMDVDMPIMNGFETAELVKEKFPWTKVIVLTMHKETQYIKRLLKTGVAGYLTKNSSNEELSNAIEVVQNGGKYLCSEVQHVLLNKVEPQESEKLTGREKEIVQLIVAGLSSKEISEKLFLSIKTVETHRGKIYKKLQVKNVAELIQYTNSNFSF